MKSCYLYRAIFLVLFITGTSVLGQGPRIAELSADQWREDLRYFADEMPRSHKDLFHSMSREEFDSAIKRFHDRIPSLTYNEIVIEYMRLIAMIRDGHTRLRIEQVFGSKGVYPLRFYHYKDGLFVQAAASQYKHLAGGKIVAIGNMPTEKALDALKEIVWRDNEMRIKAVAPTLIPIPEILYVLRITDDPDELKLTIEKDGVKQTETIKPTGQLIHLFQPPPDWADARGDSLPLWLKDPGNNFWFEYLKETNIVYVQYNAVQNKPEESVEVFFDRVYKFIENNPVEKLVIDMRNNGGGNNTLNRPMVIGLIRSKVNQPGKVFAIIGRNTFSAAQNAINELEKYTNVIFVGEPSGASPNHFGDARPVVLPNSKLTVMVSTLWWQDMDPRDDRRWTQPKITAEFSSEDYRLGRDPAMKKIIDHRQ